MAFGLLAALLRPPELAAAPELVLVEVELGLELLPQAGRTAAVASASTAAAAALVVLRRGVLMHLGLDW